jgi:hypothetical protein
MYTYLHLNKNVCTQKNIYLCILHLYIYINLHINLHAKSSLSKHAIYIHIFTNKHVYIILYINLHAKSSLSTHATFKPRNLASRAAPAPVAPDMYKYIYMNVHT